MQATYLEAIRQALFDEMARDERVFVIGEDVGAYGGAFKVTEGLLERFGERARHRHADLRDGDRRLGDRRGLHGHAAGGARCSSSTSSPAASTCSPTSRRASRYRSGAGVPIVVRGPCGGGVGGGPFHSLNPEAFFLNTPGLKMVEPSTAYDAKGLLKAAIRDDDPVLFFEHKFLYRRIKDDVPDDDYIVPIGKAAIRREGRDLSIITFGAMVHTALDAAEQLAADGVEAEVIDLRTLAPLDRRRVLDVGREDEPRADPARGDADRRHRRRDRGHHRRGGVRVPRRARHAAWRRSTRPCRTARRSKRRSCRTPPGWWRPRGDWRNTRVRVRALMASGSPPGPQPKP